jgi:hypothetical protein
MPLWKSVSEVFPSSKMEPPLSLLLYTTRTRVQALGRPQWTREIWTLLQKSAPKCVNTDEIGKFHAGFLWKSAGSAIGTSTLLLASLHLLSPSLAKKLC